VVAFAVNTEEVALPFASVVSVSMYGVATMPFAKVPLAPVAGAVNVTVAPGVGTPPVVTFATSGAANATLITALCGVPLVAVMPTAVPPVVLVRANVADGVTPVTAAVTL
jgi:hypothetical protein